MTIESREQDPGSARASRKSRGSPAIIEAGGSGGLDTSGEVSLIGLADAHQLPDHRPEHYWREWTDLDAFTQGYIEALLTGYSDSEESGRHGMARFSDLAPETLAQIIADCAEFRRLTGCPDTTEAGRAFWADRQARKPSVVQTAGRTDGIKLDVRSWPPLTPYLGDDGRVYLRERK